MPRKQKSFIDGFQRYTEGRGSPAIFRRWSGIFLVGATLERKCWLLTVKGKLYPNQYLILTGPAGVGKSLCTSTVYDLLEELRTPETPFHIAPTSVTKASLIDALNDAERRIVRPMETPAVTAFNSLTIIPNEFGVFLPSWEGDFMSTLTDLWDCGRYAETRRTSKININIPNTQLNLFSATTPAHLAGLLPEGAWEQGFMSRVLIIYSGEVVHTDLFLFDQMDEALRGELIADLRDIYRMYGAFTITDDAKEAINAWAKAGGPPVPDHPKLSSYRIRRPAHLLKLMQIASASQDSDRIITLEHFAEALDWLIELETYMPDVFKSMKTGGDGRAIDECWHYAYLSWMKHQQPVPEAKLIAFLQERVPVHNIERILDVMIRAQLLTKQFTATGGIGYQPKARKAV
jgi:hypothetical protein